jgi:hypothetical protein
MKLTMALIFLSSSLFAQVDTVYTKGHIYTGEIVSGNSANVYVQTKVYERKVIPLTMVRRAVLNNGDVIFGDGIPLAVYSTYCVNLESNRETVVDTTKTVENINPNPISNAERSTLALERIALILTVQFWLGVGFLILTLVIL